MQGGSKLNANLLGTKSAGGPFFFYPFTAFFDFYLPTGYSYLSNNCYTAASKMRSSYFWTPEAWQLRVLRD